MKARFAVAAACGLLAGHQHGIALHHHANRRGDYSRQVDGDFHRFVGLEDVDRRRTLARERLCAKNAAELEKHTTDFVRKVAHL